MLCAKNFGIARKQTLQVARKKCISEKLFRLPKKTILGRDQRFFAFGLSKMDLGSVDIWKNVSFHLNNRKICDEKRNVYCEIYIEQNI